MSSARLLPRFGQAGSWKPAWWREKVTLNGNSALAGFRFRGQMHIVRGMPHSALCLTSKRFSMSFPKLLGVVGLVIVSETLVLGQVVLTGANYSQNFDDLGSGLPTGWTVRTDASASSLGSEATLTTSATSWANVTGAFKNFASAEGLTSSSDSAAQSNSSDRALGIRQTSAFGDPGASFTLQIADTVGFQGFSVSFSAEMLSVQGRSTTWSVQYGLGASPSSFATLTTYSDPGTFGSSVVSANLPGTVDSQSENLWIRIVALSAASGSNSRDSFGIDDFALDFAPVPVPEPETYAAAAGVGLVGFAFWRRGRRA